MFAGLTQQNLSERLGPEQEMTAQKTSERINSADGVLVNYGGRIIPDL